MKAGFMDGMLGIGVPMLASTEASITDLATAASGLEAEYGQEAIFAIIPQWST